jgi:D-alanyl-lipoteichoic acid acyltransferase DltB (MBOAT superfamily)
MSFHQLNFLVLFGGVLIIYWSVARWRLPRLWVLLLASLGFYAAWNPVPLLLYLFSAAVNAIAGPMMERPVNRSASRAMREKYDRQRKNVMVVAVCIHVGVLVTSKYLTLFLRSAGTIAGWFGSDWVPPDLGLIHPLGLSFLTFQAVGYVVDVYRKQTSGKRSLLHHLLFASFFPRVVSGPILRSSQLLEKLDDRPELSSADGAAALFRITQGLAKKLLLADVLGGSLVNAVFSNPTGYSAAECVIAAVGYTLQLYFDFSGYSDIAIGIAGLLGFKFPENFAKPYHATNLFDFWNRWHLTLSTWLRDYLYRPLGGNQGTKWQTLRNTMIVMSLGGLWHGADWRFLIWGALHGLFLCLWRTWWWVRGKPKKEQVGFARKFVGWLIMFNAVVFARIFFRADNMGLAVDMFRQIGTHTTDLARVSLLAWGSLAACIVFYVLPEPVYEKSQVLFVKSPVLVRAVLIIALGLMARQFSSIESQPYIYLQY